MNRYVFNQPCLTPELLKPVSDLNKIPSWLPKGRSVLVPYARNALHMGVKVLGLKRGDEVLIPAFNCDSVYTPLHKAGLKVRLFNVFRNGRFDWKDAALQITSKTRAVLFHHYLGITTETADASAFAKRNNFFLIEDCAHSLFSNCGQTGDISIFSIRKTIPAHNLAALVVNNPKMSVPTYIPNSGFSPDHLLYLRELEIQCYRLQLQAMNTKRNVVRNTFMEQIQKGTGFYLDPSKYYPVVDVAKIVALNADAEEIRRKRRLNFKLYLDRLGNIAFVKVLPKGASPMAFPIVALKNRDRLKIMLEAKGIEPARYWPKPLLPEGAYSRFPDVAWLADRLLTLPCHQDLGSDEINYTCDILDKLL
ncbi:MAG: DegT/DnrJ/EryC1/StrS family aminotransferase [Fibrobacteres bacterium]|nr:DegT/DnrJ/EryC1/StrS family aminotransferase [Fibrobacterota bacterium]